MKIKSALLLSTLALAGTAFAQTKAPEPDYTLSYNIGAVSDYRYRGISQTGKKPAIQGGADFAHKSGLYLGAWGSTIRWIKDAPAAPATAKGPIEIDIYGGYKGTLTEGLSFDVGALQYWYAGNNLNNVPGFANPDTLEVYGALSFGPVTAKYSHSLTNLFGTVNSKGSGYLDLSATFDLGNGFSVVPHIGSQRIKNFGTYMDYSLTLNKDFDGLILSAAVVGTNWKSHFGTAYTLPGSGNKDLGITGVVLGLKKNF